MSAVGVKKRVLIEQAIARGMTNLWLMNAWGITYQQLAEIKEQMAEGSNLAGCGSHAAFNRHYSKGEAPCPSCVEGERRYQSARHERDRQRRNELQRARYARKQAERKQEAA